MYVLYDHTNIYMVEARGFEPRTLGLKVRYSSQLSYASVCLERVERIELSHNPWQGSRLPLHHTRIDLEVRVGLEPTALRICNPVHWPLCHRTIDLKIFCNRM